MSASLYVTVGCLAIASTTAHAQHAVQHVHESGYGYTQGERLEFREASRGLLWDLQGLYGGDYRRFVWKTEGDYADGEVESAELQLLYGHAWTAFFDLQFGLRFADTAAGGITSAVAGMQGLLPYRIESDLALFVSEDGDVTGRAEFEKDFLLTERWILQPRLELDLAFTDNEDPDIDQGVTELGAGLRLRYEITRRFAPYLGVAWNRHYGGQDEGSSTSAVAGIRFWF